MDTGLACFVMLARYHELAADAEQLKHQFGQSDQPFTSSDILRAAKALGLKARRTDSAFHRLANTPLPAIAEHRDQGFFIIAKVSDDQVLVHDPVEKRPIELSRKALEQIWSGRLILVKRRVVLVTENLKFGFKWFIPEIMKHKKLLGEVVIASFFIQLFALMTPLFFQVVIDKVLVHRGLTTLDVLAIGFLVVSLFDVVLNGLRTYQFSHTSNRIDVVLGARLFKHLLALPMAYFEARRVGHSVARVRELETIRNFLTGSSLTLIIDLFFTIVFLVVMYYYSPVLTYVVVGALPFYIVLSVLVTPILRARLNEKFQRGAEQQAFLVEAVTGVETLKANALEPQAQRRWEGQLAGYQAASFKTANLGNISSQTAGFVNKVTTLLILWVGAHLVIEGNLSVGQLIAFNMLAGRISGPILKLVQLWQDFQQAGISLQRLGDILNTKPEPGYNPSRASLPPLAGEVSFQGVSFRYQPNGQKILDDISLDVAPGEAIGIVGRSGSGKSTLTKLIQRLHIPEAGRVRVDGIDLGLIDPSWLRRQIGVVLQDNFLFNRTIRENIALSDPGMPFERIVQAAKMAGAHEFITELAEGYDTLVEEQGSNLSGGQRQRLAIARALVTNPRILIFDEATSALDYESERIIQENMKAICRGRTVFIIAHRLSAVRQANRIVVIDKGRVVEQGSHDELIGRNGQYASLHHHQQGLHLVAANRQAG